MKLTLHEYQPLALRTNAKGNDKLTDLTHCVLGLSSELGELVKDIDDIPNSKQEVGDLMWYIAIGCDAIDWDLNELVMSWPGTAFIMDDLAVNIGIIADKVKRATFYKTPLDEEKIVKAFSSLVYTLGELAANVLDTTLEECLYLNIAKLRIRYPDAFTEYAAVNRDVEKEETIFNDRPSIPLRSNEQA